MLLSKHKNSFLIVAVMLLGYAANAQISGVFPTLHCIDTVVDGPTACTISVFCTQPPNPIPGFVIGANAFKTCPNQPVENTSQADAAIAGTQASSQGKATALFFQRLIKQQIRVADCQGNTSLLFDFDDPQGCNPPPPPPPPTPTPTPPPQCDPDTPQDLRSGTGEDNNPCASPIIIDTTGNGYHLTSAASGVLFDISGSGTPIRLAWTQPGSGNAFLVLPRSDGSVTNGQQLFGNFTPQPPSSTPNGYAALAVYDQSDHGGNGDGVIDQNDQIFSSLRLWLDENHDGVCQPEELYTLPQLGVLSISLDYSLSKRTDDFGNLFRYKARINQGTRREDDPVGRKAYDVFFVTQ